MPKRYRGGEFWVSSHVGVEEPTGLTISPEVGRWWFLALYETPLLFSGLLDREGRVLEGNQASIEGCGFDRDAIVGQPFWECGWWQPDPDLAASIRAWCHRVLETTDSLRTTTHYFLRDGSMRMVDLSLHPVFDRHSDSGDAYIVATGLDVTDALTARVEREERLALEADALRAEAEAKVRDFVLLQESEHFIRDRLSRLASAAIDMVGVDSIEDLTSLIFDRAFPILGADGGALIVRDRNELRVFLSDRLSEPARIKYEEAPFDSPWPGRHVARTGERLILPTREDGIAFLPEMAEVYKDTGRLAWAYVPLKARGELLGSMAVSWREEREIAEDEIALIEAVAAQCAQVIERLRMTQANRESAIQIDHMVESIQRSLLTSSPTSSRLDIGTHYVPAAQAVQVGGDWYDAFTTKIGSNLLVVGDVAGHDGDAAAAMAQLRNLFRGLAADGMEGPASLLGLLDEAIDRLDLDAVATVLVAELRENHDRFICRWASAGHLPPILKRADDTVEILSKPSDLLLGVDAKANRNEYSFELAPDEILLFFTDGLVEQRTESLDTGLGRLARALGGAGHGPSSEICNELVRQMFSSAPDDDVVILVVQALNPTPGDGGLSCTAP